MGEALFLTLWDKAATILSRRLNSKHQRSEEHTSELQSQSNLVCRLLLEKKKNYRHSSPSACPSRTSRPSTCPPTSLRPLSRRCSCLRLRPHQPSRCRPLAESSSPPLLSP